MLINNFDALTNNGEHRLRKDALEIINAGLQAVIPYEKTKSIVDLNKFKLLLGEKSLDLRSFERIYVVGVGKGSFPIAQALDETLGDLITEGFLVVKKGESRRLKHIEVVESGHPLPDQTGIKAGEHISKLFQSLTDRDLVISPITGGSSALLNLPQPGISLEDLVLINKMLLSSGAPIEEMNSVRKHLCQLKGGGFAELAKPATLVTLSLRTGSADLAWPDLSLPDSTTFEDAINVLERYNLLDKSPKAIVAHLKKGADDPNLETPKFLTNKKNYIYYVASPEEACYSAKKHAEALGYSSYVLSSKISGEARDLGYFFAALADEIEQNGQPFKKPCAIISGGETTVTLQSQSFGLGGPNQETCLGFAQKVSPNTESVCVCIDTDGSDGPTVYAGGMTDNLTSYRVNKEGKTILDTLLNHSSTQLLMDLNDLIVTGSTGTNVMNLRVVLVR